MSGDSILRRSFAALRIQAADFRLCFNNNILPDSAALLSFRRTCDATIFVAEPRMDPSPAVYL